MPGHASLGISLGWRRKHHLASSLLSSGKPSKGVLKRGRQGRSVPDKRRRQPERADKRKPKAGACLHLLDGPVRAYSSGAVAWVPPFGPRSTAVCAMRASMFARPRLWEASRPARAETWGVAMLVPLQEA